MSTLGHEDRVILAAGACPDPLAPWFAGELWNPVGEVRDEPRDRR
jgi:hypothetical protein